MLQHLLIKSAAILVVCPAFVVYSGLQETRKIQESAPLIYNGDSSEDSKLGLDDAASAANADKLIILIARPGSRESSRAINRRRLKTARDYLKNTRSISSQRIVAAEGEPADGQGRVEVYIDGKLYIVFMMGQNKDFAREP